MGAAGRGALHLCPCRHPCRAILSAPTHPAFSPPPAADPKLTLLENLGLAGINDARFFQARELISEHITRRAMEANGNARCCAARGAACVGARPQPAAQHRVDLASPRRRSTSMHCCAALLQARSWERSSWLQSWMGQSAAASSASGEPAAGEEGGACRQPGCRLERSHPTPLCTSTQAWPCLPCVSRYPRGALMVTPLDNIARSVVEEGYCSDPPLYREGYANEIVKASAACSYSSWLPVLLAVSTPSAWPVGLTPALPATSALPCLPPAAPHGERGAPQVV